MGCTVRELLHKIDARELVEWGIYYELEPFGPNVNNLNAGLVASIMANVYSKKGAKTIKPEDIAFGDFGKEMAKQTPEDHKVMVEMLAQAFNAKVIKREK